MDGCRVMAAREMERNLQLLFDRAPEQEQKGEVLARTRRLC